MKRYLLVSSLTFLAACSGESPSLQETPETVNTALGETETALAKASVRAMSLLNTTWEFDDDGAPTVVTIE